ncbi:uncharacterized protein LOC8032594 [Ixodes scapularis]|uniref:uncharacterized protein LOC8032594 n=1 Tax=Ixodes scapularis TaxID=6945 RepID=UPI001A9D51F7|nr:uncharacterized protein LOC8032594 [Ixodes scapularis]
MKQESPEGDVLPRPACSSSTSSSPEHDHRARHDDNGYDLPMDLRKKSPKSSEDASNDDSDAEASSSGSVRRVSHPHAMHHAWQKIFQSALPSPAPPVLQQGKGPPEQAVRFSAPDEKDPDQPAASRSNPLTKSSHDDKENQCDCSCRGDECDVTLLDLRKDSSSKSGSESRVSSCPYRTDKDSNPTLIRFLEARALSPPHRQDDLPEDLSSTKVPRSVIVPAQDSVVKRSSSCSRLFEITSESLVERLMRARCKSDSEIQHRNSSQSSRSGTEESLPSPPSERSASLTLKRRILGGLHAADGQTKAKEEALKVARLNSEIDAKPASLPCSPPNDQRPQQETLLQQLRQLAPAALPFSIYAYYTQIMQRLHEHELLKRHLEGIAVSAAIPAQALGAARPSPATGLDSVEDSDELASGLDTYNCSMRKRAPRALTGKHVKHGTGASPATLLTLRQKIQERQRARQLGLLEPTVRTLKGTRRGFGKGPAKKQPLKK